MNEERSCARASDAAAKTSVLVMGSSHGTQRGFRENADNIDRSFEGACIVLRVNNNVEHYKVIPREVNASY